MKKIPKFPSFRKVKKLEEALGEQNIAKALDMIEVIRDDKKPELSKSILSKVEDNLIYILNNMNLDKKIITNHFKSLLKIIQQVVMDNKNNILLAK